MYDDLLRMARFRGAQPTLLPSASCDAGGGSGSLVRFPTRASGTGEMGSPEEASQASFSATQKGAASQRKQPPLPAVRSGRRRHGRGVRFV